MQVSVESTGALERRMEIHVPAERIEKAVDERLKKMSRTVRLKGFRPGQSAGQRRATAVRPAGPAGSAGRRRAVDICRSCHTGKTDAAGGPRIEPISSEEGGDLKYRAVFEVLPQIELAGVENLEIHAPDGGSHAG